MKQEPIAPRQIFRLAALKRLAEKRKQEKKNERCFEPEAVYGDIVEGKMISAEKRDEETCEEPGNPADSGQKRKPVCWSRRRVLHRIFTQCELCL